MNMDNTRLREIQEFKTVYYKEMDKSKTINERINELEKEEKEILARGGVKI